MKIVTTFSNPKEDMESFYKIRDNNLTYTWFGQIIEIAGEVSQSEIEPKSNLKGFKGI